MNHTLLLEYCDISYLTGWWTLNSVPVLNALLSSRAPSSVLSSRPPCHVAESAVPPFGIPVSAVQRISPVPTPVKGVFTGGKEINVFNRNDGAEIK